MSETLPHPVRSVAFGADGRLLASAGVEDIVRLWDATTGELLGTLGAGPDVVVTIDFSPDGRVLVTGGEDGVVRVWGLPPGQTD